MKMIGIVLLTLILPLNDSGWELAKDENGIRLYTRLEEGYAIKAVRAETTFDASLETCVAVLRDIDHLEELFPNCTKALKIEQDASSQIHYLQLDAPWPVADRDGAFGLHYSYDAAQDMVLVEAGMIGDAYPEQSGFVRLRNGNGTWKFTRVSASQTRLEYYYLGDGGGKIPAWLANSVVEENPFKMLTNFHELVKLERYKGSALTFVQ